MQADGDVPARHHVLTVAGGGVTIEERPAGDPDARVSGTVSDWVRALGPGGDLDALEVDGPRKLVDAVLGSFAQAGARATAAA